jgi:hypothetical protein
MSYQTIRIKDYGIYEQITMGNFYITNAQNTGKIIFQNVFRVGSKYTFVDANNETHTVDIEIKKDRDYIQFVRIFRKERKDGGIAFIGTQKYGNGKKK